MPLTVTEGVLPASMLALGPGHWFVDLGKEIQGGLTVSFPPGTAAAGVSLQVRLGEEMLSWSPPAVRYDMRTNNKYVHTWVLRDGQQTLEHHEYLEFRFVELLVMGAPAQCAVSAPADYSTPVTLGCEAPGQTIAAVEFASWGAPSGACIAGAPGANSFAPGTCAAPGVPAVLASLCVGHASCTFVPSDALFDGGRDPCDKVPKYLAAAVTCAAGTGGVAGDVVGLPMPNVSAWVLTYNPSAYSFAAPSAAMLPGSPAPRQVTTSSAQLNSVWDLCQYTVVATALDMYTDSNTRQRSVIW